MTEKMGVPEGEGEGEGESETLFPNGSLVEVSSDQEGFEGAWYEATIVRPSRSFNSSSSSPPSSGSSERKKRKTTSSRCKYLVEYCTLFVDEDDESIRLREFVDVRFLRPLPPTDIVEDRNHCFRVSDVVDAFHRDGWWTGVITRVVDEGSKFVVYFKKPPDEIEFGRSELRVHREWVHGNWIRPENQEIIHLYSKNPKHLGKVEKAIQLKKPARTEDDTVQTTPSSTKSKNKGTGPPTSFNIKVSSCPMTSTKKKHKDSPDTNATLSLPLKKLRKKYPDESSLSLTPRGPVTAQIQELSKEALVGSNTLAGGCSGVDCSKKFVVDDQFFAKIVSSQENRSDIGRPEDGLSIQKKKRGRPPKLLTEKQIYPSEGGSFSGKTGSREKCQLQLSNEPHVKLIMQSILQGPPSHGDILGNITEKPPANNDKELNQTVVNVTGKRFKKNAAKKCTIRSLAKKSPSAILDSEKAFRGKTSDVSEAVRMIKDAVDTVTNELSEMEGDNQPLGDDSRVSPRGTSNENGGPTVRPESEMHPPTVAGTVNECAEASERQDGKETDLPFFKHSPLWQSLESLEVFKMTPQKPHFRPLADCKEDAREGFAIGNMVTFANVVERVSMLKFDDPRSIIDRSLETLLELEPHGFDVQPVKDRLSELLSAKERQERLEQDSKEVESKIIKHTMEKTRIDEEIQETAKQVETLQEKLALAALEKEMKDCEIAQLQSTLIVTYEDLRKVQRDFESLAASPW